MFLTALVLILNFVISWWNASTVGMYWSERRRLPGGMQVSLWAGAVMAVCGFFTVYLPLVAGIMYVTHTFEFFAALMKLNLEPSEVKDLVQAVFDLSFILIIIPVLGSGYVIWINSMVVAYQRRTVGSMGVAGWNTFANIRNTVTAVRYMPKAAKGVAKPFRSKKGVEGVLILILMLLPIVVSLGGAIWTTWAIMSASDVKYQLEDAVKA